MGYLKIELSEELIAAALRRSSEVGVLDGSHRHESANLVGTIGELVFTAMLSAHGVPFEDATDRTDYDYVVGSGSKVDVKTKDRTVFPRAGYDNSVPLYNHDHQRPDWYYFISLYRPRERDGSDPYRFTHACLLGAIDQEDLASRGKVWDAGEVDPDNGTRFWTACINVKMEDLLPTRDFLVSI